MKLSDWVIEWYSSRPNPIGKYNTEEELNAKDKIIRILESIESTMDNDYWNAQKQRWSTRSGSQGEA